MCLYPDLYLNNVKEISIEILKEKNIKGLILDIDNTLIDYDKQIIENAEECCNNLKNQGI